MASLKSLSGLIFCLFVFRHFSVDGSSQFEREEENELVQMLPDPLSINDFNMSDNGVFTSFKGQFKSMELRGMKNLKIESTKFNLEWMHMDVVMTIPHLRMDGIYNLNGKVLFIPIRGSGDFWMRVRNLKFFATSSLNRTDDGKFQISAIVLDADSKRTDTHFSNLMGLGMGGEIGAAFSNLLVNELNDQIFSHVKESIISNLQTDVQASLNQMLYQLPDNFVHEKSASLFDELLDKLRHEIVKTGHDPLSLPDSTESFSEDLKLFRVHGALNIFNGSLSGLSTVVRTGPVYAHYQKFAVILEANIGFENITGDYNWDANFMGEGPSGAASVNVNGIDSFVRIRQPLKKGSKAELQTLKIKNIKNVWVNIKGLGPFDVILDVIINMISNTFKTSLSKSIEGPIKKVLQEELNKIPLDYFV